MASALRFVAVAMASAFLAGGALAQRDGGVEAGGMKFGALPSQTLKPGQCGLFLWSRTERPEFIVFVPDNPARATAIINGRIRQLDRKTKSGDLVLGHYRKQSFASGAFAFELELTYDADRTVKDGAIIRQGVLRTYDRKGGTTVVPVGGMIGCQAR